MNNVKDKPVKFTLDGITYDLVFNLNVIEQVMSEYESFKVLNKELLSKKDIISVKAIKVTLKALIDDAVTIHNETNEEKLSYLSTARIGHLLKKRDMPVIIGVILEAQSRALPDVGMTDDEIEGESKN